MQFKVFGISYKYNIQNLIYSLIGFTIEGIDYKIYKPFMNIYLK